MPVCFPHSQLLPFLLSGKTEQTGGRVGGPVLWGGGGWGQREEGDCALPKVELACVG